MKVTIITDASFCPQTGAAGYGYWIASERGKQPGGGPMKSLVSTSGAAEMLAVCNSLFVAVKQEFVMRGDNVLMQTDSLAAIFAFQGSRKLTNPQEVEALQYFRDLRQEHAFLVEFRHVKGHTRREEARFVTNNLCDERAKVGMREARAKLKELENVQAPSGADGSDPQEGRVQNVRPVRVQRNDVRGIWRRFCEAQRKRDIEPGSR